MKRIRYFLLAIMLVFVSTDIFARVPREFTYQGKLLGNGEQPVPEGHYKITFSLYNEQGTSLWSETHDHVFIAGGIFQVNLGSVNGMPLPFNEPYYLGIKIGTDPELTPRMLLTTSPYSFRAEDANHIGGIRASNEPEPNVLYPLGNDGKFPDFVLPAGAPSGNYLKKGEPDTSRGTSNGPMLLVSNSGNGDGIVGKSVDGVGASARSDNSDGFVGWTAAIGKSGVFGHSTNGRGVVGRSDKDNGVVGWTGDSDKSGIYGHSVNCIGVEAHSDNNYAISGHSSSTNEWIPAVYGKNVGVGDGVYGWSQCRYGVFGVTSSQNPEHAGVYGINHGNGYAGRFDGRIRTNVLEIVGGSDLSERFKIRGMGSKVLPSAGMVVCIDPENPGNLIVSNKAYDRRVAGIISGAGGIKPGMLMCQKDSEADGADLVALTGRVYCLADASNFPIKPGDLLTTSEIPGRAMKVNDYVKAQGAIIGKAMSSLDEGQGLVLVLVTLQ